MWAVDPGAVDGDAAVERRRMRAGPPEETLRWLLDELAAVEIVELEVMPGGSTSAMHRVRVRQRNGLGRTVVLRRYVLGQVVVETPDVAAREWTALGVVAPAPLPTPLPLAADLNGDVTDVPTIAMSWLEGRPVWDGRPRQRWLDQIVDAMIEVHTIKIPARTAVPPIERYEQRVYQPPAWSTRPGVWERAFELFHGPIPDCDVGFVHRDFHPGNTLWRRGRLSGVTDWQAACVGPASIDPGHCRLNLLYTSLERAEQLRTTWERRSGHRYQPWADVMSIVGVLDSHRTNTHATTAMRAIEHTLARAVADLAG